MNQKQKKLGVTLIEVLLVCAVSALILVVAVRYYENVSATEQANQTIALINSITAAADRLRAGSGTYNIVSTNNVKGLIGSMTLPWGAEASIVEKSASEYKVSLPDVPPNICIILESQLPANKYLVIQSYNCNQTREFTYKYFLTPQRTS